MKLYNTLTKQIEELKPLDGATIRMYSCGPTVYDHAHIGNLSAFIVADTLKRTLRAAGYQVQHVMNFTDVDDKTIRRSRELYPSLDPKEALIKLTRSYEDAFKKDMQLIGNSIDDIEFVRATDAIPAMQVLISELHDNDYAYIADDGVYFSIEAYKKSGKTYGQLTHIDSNNTSQARITNDEYDKESVHDFALWKTTKEGEPSWIFTLDGKHLDGRPGWHIECSAMSTMQLGQPFDIHTGGVDLIFPHHENEIAQSTAGKEDTMYAKTFVHSEHLLVDGKKMSKSLSNFYTLKDITAKGFDPLAFRLLVLQSHYRSQSNFSWENLQAAQARLSALRAMADLRFQPVDTRDIAIMTKLGALRKELLAEQFNDLNTPESLKYLGETEDVVNANYINHSQLDEFEIYLKNIDDLFGLQLTTSNDITPEHKQLLAERSQARSEKDWDKADTLRIKLKEFGIEVRDTPHDQVWSRS